MVIRDALNTLGLVALFAGALFVNDLVLERRMGDYLSSHPQIVLSAMARAQAQAADATAEHMQQQLAAHWSVLSQTRAYAVRFDGTKFVSRLVRMGDIATPKSLNLVATDYRCHFCKGDRGAVDAMLRSRPNRDFLFVEAAVLGPESIELARDVLTRSQGGGEDYYLIHNRQFDVPSTGLKADGAKAEDAVLAEQKKFLEIVGVGATPTYIRDGVIRSGTLGTPEG